MDYINSTKIIEEIENYLINFIEKPTFNKFPICPFAKSARLNKKILYRIAYFDFNDLEEISNLEFENYEIMILVHPGTIDFQVLALMAEKLNTMQEKYTIFTGHPNDDFIFQGIKVRQDSYPNLQFIKTELLEKKRKSLENTNYWVPNT
jgi:hypothetical protein